jgi:hypothetical protein
MFIRDGRRPTVRIDHGWECIGLNKTQPNQRNNDWHEAAAIATFDLWQFTFSAARKTLDGSL